MAQLTEKFHSPFLDVKSFPRQQPEALEENLTSPGALSASSPFVSVYEREGAEERSDPDSEEMVQFLGDLHDDGFDEAVFELVNEASALYEDRFVQEYRDTASHSVEAERFLREHFAPLENELETLLDNLVDDVERLDFDGMTETEVEAFIESYPLSGQLSPNFENFGGWFKKKLRKAAKWAKRKAKALAKRAFKAAIRKIRRYLKPLLKKILTFAIGKLPKKYQGMANKLRKRLGYEIEEEEVIEAEQDTTGDIDQIQQELNLYIANLLLNDDETQHELILAEIVQESEQPVADPLAELEIAREQFIEGILDLKKGGDPTPLVENFLPAVMWAVKIGLKFYGRPKLVKYLAKHLAKLIRRYVGRHYAKPLAKVIVDAGLRLVNLEATEQEALHAAGGVVASMVEDTLHEVANLPDYILDDEDLLEGFVLEAFEKAATRNLPEVLPEEAYIKRPNLREAKGLKGTWLHKLRRRKKSYKKFSRKLKAKLSFHKLRALKSFGEVPVLELLQSQFGPGAGTDLEADVHLYEAIVGSTLAKISRHETSTPGLGTGDRWAYSQLHPLTPEAAGLLFGEPGLGRSMPARFLTHRRRIGVGQRFYYLEIPGTHRQMTPRADSAAQGPRISGLKLVLDFPQQQIRVSLFISESAAQTIAVNLRQKLSIGSVMPAVQSVLQSGLTLALSEQGGGNSKIIHPTVLPQQIRGALQNLPPKLMARLNSRLIDWLGRGLSDYFRQKPDGFIAATEDRKDGVTLNITLDSPPDFALLAKVLRGAKVATADINLSGAPSQTQIKPVAGYDNG